MIESVRRRFALKPGTQPGRLATALVDFWNPAAWPLFTSLTRRRMRAASNLSPPTLMAKSPYESAYKSSPLPEKSSAEHLSKIVLLLSLITYSFEASPLRRAAFGSASRCLLGALPRVPRQCL